MRTRAVLCVGGSDPSAGAGIQADLRTLEMLGVSALTVVTAVTVQDGRRMLRCDPVAPALIAEQIRALRKGFELRAVKCGLIPTAAAARAVALALRRSSVPLVLDPVLRASAGARLARRGVESAIADHLFPLARVVTLNLEEVAVWTGRRPTDVEAMCEAAREIATLGPKAVVVKGGHLDGRDAVDVLFDGRRVFQFGARRIDRGDLHGSGCAFASALAAGLSRGEALPDAVRRAKRHVRVLIRQALPIAGSVLLRRPPGSI